jgi:hypothetical protein
VFLRARHRARAPARGGLAVPEPRLRLLPVVAQPPHGASCGACCSARRTRARRATGAVRR